MGPVTRAVTRTLGAGIGIVIAVLAAISDAAGAVGWACASIGVVPVMTVGGTIIGAIGALTVDRGLAAARRRGGNASR